MKYIQYVEVDLFVFISVTFIRFEHMNESTRSILLKRTDRMMVVAQRRLVMETADTQQTDTVGVAQKETEHTDRQTDTRIQNGNNETEYTDNNTGRTNEPRHQNKAPQKSKQI